MRDSIDKRLGGVRDVLKGCEARRDVARLAAHHRRLHSARFRVGQVGHPVS